MRLEWLPEWSSASDHSGLYFADHHYASERNSFVLHRPFELGLYDDARHEDLHVAL
jgi:hypothetical protein